AYR
ncbi:putative lipid II flippase FtsW, partial [Stenotrophomonas maltophilia]